MNINRILLSVTILLSLTLIAQQVSDSNLIAHYPLDGNGFDISENELHGEVVGATPTTNRYGAVNSAIQFDGENDFINLTANQKLKPYPPVTITAWINYTSIPAVMWGNSFNEDFYYGIRFNITYKSNLTIQYCNGFNIGPESRRGVISPINQSDRWIHVVGVIDENYEGSLYINGVKVPVEESGNANELIYDSGPAVIGKLDSQTYGPPFFFEGKMDDFRLYNRVLTEKEIEELYENYQPIEKYILRINDTIVNNNAEYIKVPVYLQIPEAVSLQSFEIDITGLMSDLDFLGIDLSESELIDNSWKISSNGTSSKISIAGAGSNHLSDTLAGLLFHLEFELLEPLLESKTILLNISKATMNDNSIPVKAINGFLKISASEVNYGDVDLDGQVRALDASKILQYLIGQYELTEPQFEAADVTLDSTVSGLDAQIILDFLTGKVESLPHIPDSSMINFDGDFYMEDVIANENEDLEIPLYLSTSSNIFSIEGSINYDSENFDIIGIELARSYLNFSIDYTTTQNDISFAAFGEAVPDGDSLLILKLRNKNYIESSPIVLDRVRVNESDNQLNVTTSNINLITGVDDELSLSYSLEQNYPNPFNPSTIIAFTIPHGAEVRIEVFDVLGKKVSTLVDRFFVQGKHKVKFNSEEINSGLYFYNISVGNFTDTKKMMILK